MKTLLVTCFEPFGSEKINASMSAAALMPDEIGACRVVKTTLPVVFGEAGNKAISAALDCKADAVLCVGEAKGRKDVTPEAVAVNIRYAAIPDNAGNEPRDVPVIPGGREAFFSNAPVRRIAETIAEAGVPASVSYSAGTYVCNDLYYTVLDRFSGAGTPVLFVHLPAAPEWGTPSLDSKRSAAALIIAARSLINSLEK
ncbi:MAG: pyroglutamyl-peptidase I [Clostridia bacterium]|nr:pyroglutamyl-peptidase I [Clostridia bacterium]